MDRRPGIGGLFTPESVRMLAVIPPTLAEMIHQRIPQNTSQRISDVMCTVATVGLVTAVLLDVSNVATIETAYSVYQGSAVMGLLGLVFPRISYR